MPKPLPLITPLRVATDELKDARRTLAYWRGEGREKENARAVIAACRKRVRAFERIVGSASELEIWWARFSPEGKRLIIGTYATSAGAGEREE